MQSSGQLSSRTLTNPSLNPMCCPRPLLNLILHPELNPQPYMNPSYQPYPVRLLIIMMSLYQALRKVGSLGSQVSVEPRSPAVQTGPQTLNPIKPQP